MTFDELRTADYKFPTVALFWGLNCAPCEVLKPKLREICKAMGTRLEEFQASEEMAAVRSLGLRAVPSVVVVGRMGTVQFAFSGSHPNIRKALVDAGARDNG